MRVKLGIYIQQDRPRLVNDASVMNTARLDQAYLRLSRRPRVCIRRMQAYLGIHQRIKSPYLNSHASWDLVMILYLFPNL